MAISLYEEEERPYQRPPRIQWDLVNDIKRQIAINLQALNILAALEYVLEPLSDLVQCLQVLSPILSESSILGERSLTLRRGSETSTIFSAN